MTSKTKSEKVLKDCILLKVFFCVDFFLRFTLKVTVYNTHTHILGPVHFLFLIFFMIKYFILQRCIKWVVLYFTVHELTCSVLIVYW